MNSKTEATLDSKLGLQIDSRYLRRMIIPLILEQVLGVTVGMADTVMVSRVGEAAMSGVSLVDTINILLINLFMSMSTGGVVIASQALGRSDRRKASESANQLLLLILSLSLLVMTVALLGNRQILSLIFGQVEADVLGHGVTYFYIIALSFPFLAIQGGCSALCRAMGNTRVTFFVSIIINLINIGGNALLLLVFNWGVAGVATATLVARIVGAALLFYVLRNPRNDIVLPRPFSFRFDFGLIKKILHIAVPTGLDSAIFQVGKILVQSLIVTFGTAAIAANAVVGLVAGIAYIPGNAIGMTMLPVVGQCIGAEDYPQAKSYIRKLMLVCFGAMGGLNLLIILVAPWLVGIYNLSGEGAQMAYQVILYHSVAAMIIWPFAFTLPNALRAAGDVRFAMIVSILSMWIFRIALSYYLGQVLGWQLLGVWVAMSVDWLARGILFLYRILSGHWLRYHKRKQLKESS